MVRFVNAVEDAEHSLALFRAMQEAEARAEPSEVATPETPHGFTQVEFTAFGPRVVFIDPSLPEP